MSITAEYTQSTFLITIFSHQIRTTITHHPTEVSTFISTIQTHHDSNPISPTIVGLDIEWRPSFSSYTPPIATLQLCIASQCLIFQIIHAPSIPDSLFDFLDNPNFCFVGVGIREDVDKLWMQSGLYVRNWRDLREMVVEQTGRVELRNAGLMGLGREILGWEIEKPKNVTLSNWENERLSPQQIQYACVDAYLSYSIGQSLIYESSEDQQNPALDDNERFWNYEDPNGRTQGSFCLEQVREWETDYPESFEDQQRDALDDRESRWSYEDPNGRTQGPFNLEQLRDSRTAYPGCEANGHPIATFPLPTGNTFNSLTEALSRLQVSCLALQASTASLQAQHESLQSSDTLESDYYPYISPKTIHECPEYRP